MLTIGAANSVASSASRDGQTVTVKASLARVSEKFPRLAPKK